jgi:hypothetical protein
MRYRSTPILAKVEVVGSNPTARSRLFVIFKKTLAPSHNLALGKFRQYGARTDDCFRQKSGKFVAAMFAPVRSMQRLIDAGVIERQSQRKGKRGYASIYNLADSEAHPFPCPLARTALLDDSRP